MKRSAIRYQTSPDQKRSFYIDEAVEEELFTFLMEDEKRLKKFRQVIGLVLSGLATRDQYARENIEKGCEHVYALKLFKGGQNIRIYCQQFSSEDKNTLIITAAEFLSKKKTQKLSQKQRNIIRRVASYQYQLKDE